MGIRNTAAAYKRQVVCAYICFSQALPISSHYMISVFQALLFVRTSLEIVYHD